MIPLSAACLSGRQGRQDAKSVAGMTQRAVLIAGGFHTPNLKSILRSKNVSFIVLTPQVTAETNQARYESILLNQKIDPLVLQNAPLLQSMTSAVLTLLNPSATRSLVGQFDSSQALMEAAAARMAEAIRHPKEHPKINLRDEESKVQNNRTIAGAWRGRSTRRLQRLAHGKRTGPARQFRASPVRGAPRGAAGGGGEAATGFYRRGVQNLSLGGAFCVSET